MEIEARAMTGKEVKNLKKAGFEPMGMANVDEKDATKAGIQAIKMFDWIADNIYQDEIEKVDEMPYPEKLKLGQKTYQLTYNFTDDEAKN